MRRAMSVALIALALAGCEKKLIGGGAKLTPEQEAVKGYVLAHAGAPGSVEFVKWFDPLKAPERDKPTGKDLAAVVRVHYREAGAAGSADLRDELFFVDAELAVRPGHGNRFGDRWDSHFRQMLRWE